MERIYCYLDGVSTEMIFVALIRRRMLKSKEEKGNEKDRDRQFIFNFKGKLIDLANR